MSETKKVHVRFFLDETGRKDSLRRGGDGKRNQVASFDLTPEWLELAEVDRDGCIEVDLRRDVTHYRWEIQAEEYRLPDSPPELAAAPVERTVSTENVRVCAPFDHVPDEVELLATAQAVRAAEKARAAREEADREIVARRRDIQSAKDRFREINSAFFSAEKARQEEERRLREAEAAREEAAIDADRIAWIEAHGSERLRLAAANGYRHKRIYVDERLALGFPGYVADHGKAITEDSRYNPSLEALRELERLRPILAEIPGVNEEKLEIVWLPKGLSELDDDDDEWGDEESDEACEAVRFILDGVYCYRVAL